MLPKLVTQHWRAWAAGSLVAKGNVQGGIAYLRTANMRAGSVNVAGPLRTVTPVPGHGLRR